MSKIMQMSPTAYSDVAFVEGIIRRDRKIVNALYRHCSLYFTEHKQAVLFAPESEMDRIFNESFETLWDNIEKGKIRVAEDKLIGYDGRPFTGKLTTYLMSIIKFKFKEYVRGSKIVMIDALKRDKQGRTDNCFENNIDCAEDFLYSEEDLTLYDVLAMCIAEMSERCSQILTKIYYEYKDYDVIMKELPTFTSKNALKTAKNKCMDKLKFSANTMWKNHLNS